MATCGQSFVFGFHIRTRCRRIITHSLFDYTNLRHLHFECSLGIVCFVRSSVTWENTSVIMSLISSTMAKDPFWRF